MQYNSCMQAQMYIHTYSLKLLTAPAFCSLLLLILMAYPCLTIRSRLEISSLKKSFFYHIWLENSPASPRVSVFNLPIDLRLHFDTTTAYLKPPEMETP